MREKKIETKLVKEHKSSIYADLEEERENKLVDLLIKIIVSWTLREYYKKSN